MAEDPPNSERPEPSDEEYPLLPPEPQQVKPRPPRKAVDLDELFQAEPKEEFRFQFSLAEMMGLTAAAALVLGLLSYLPGGHSLKGVAGVAGCGLILCGLVLELVRPGRRILYVGWVAAFVLYLMICLAAIVVS